MKLKHKILAICMTALSVFGVGCSDLGQVLDELKCAHDYGTTPTHVLKTASCSQEGVEVWTCLKCRKERQITQSKLAHTEIVDKGVEATTVSAGKTDGKHCTTCGEVTLAQKEIARESFSMQLPTLQCWGDGNSRYIRMMYYVQFPDYEEIHKEHKGNIEYGIVYTRADWVEQTGPLNYENLFGENALYTFDQNDGSGRTYVSRFQTDNSDDTYIDKHHYHGNGSKFTAYSENFKVYYTAIGYVKLGDEYIFATYPEGYTAKTYKFSAYDLVKADLKDGKMIQKGYLEQESVAITDDLRTWLQTTFITPAESA